MGSGEPYTQGSPQAGPIHPVKQSVHLGGSKLSLQIPRLLQVWFPGQSGVPQSLPNKKIEIEVFGFLELRLIN